MNEAEQLAIPLEVDETAYLLSVEDLGKRYTADQAQAVEWKRNACLYMLSRQCPVEDIGRVLGMHLLTVRALAVRNGRALAGFTEEFARELFASGAGDLALADTKRDNASYLQLVTGGAIKIDKGMAVKMIAEGSGPKPIEIEAEEGKLSGLREKMKLLKPAVPEPQT